MVFTCPKTVRPVLGFFVFLALIDGALRFDLLSLPHTVCNTGIALGIRLPDSFLWLSTALFLCIALYQAYRRHEGVEQLAWMAVFTGGAINAIDRGLHGCVTDYLHLPFFPSFNLADIMLSLGVMVLLVVMLGIMPNVKTYVR
ncbi:MAG: signal peptidase II [Candidatus Moraniibacteriota bacterium]